MAKLSTLIQNFKDDATQELGDSIDALGLDNAAAEQIKKDLADIPIAIGNALETLLKNIDLSPSTFSYNSSNGSVKITKTKLK